VLFIQSLKEELAHAKSEAATTASSYLKKEAEQEAKRRKLERLEAELSSSLNTKLEERDQAHARAVEAIKAEAAEATRTLVAQHAQVVCGLPAIHLPNFLFAQPFTSSVHSSNISPSPLL
jgi:Skp family chaperone for outer membrane proteins